MVHRPELLDRRGRGLEHGSGPDGTGVRDAKVHEAGVARRDDRTRHVGRAELLEPALRVLRRDARRPVAEDDKRQELRVAVRVLVDDDEGQVAALQQGRDVKRPEALAVLGRPARVRDEGRDGRGVRRRRAPDGRHGCCGLLRERLASHRPMGGAPRSSKGAAAPNSARLRFRAHVYLSGGTRKSEPLLVRGREVRRLGRAGSSPESWRRPARIFL